ncbi:hypothetical protein MSAN_01982500 [Mycena sanguinolenta]|uniref:Uncharacterized protein n=1 Tax=Mycena sanguinolenta TaxID=230812 RepID=A0A8H6XN27_9AGAR|nr:hypothetical protein MSAN_01982500 [Mycena sanguinolenta]
MSGIRTPRSHFEIGNSAVRRRCQKMTESEAYWGPGTNWYGDKAWGQPAWGQSAWGQSLTSGQTPVWDESAGPPASPVSANIAVPPTPPTPITWADLERRARNPDVAEIRAAWECFFRAGQEPRVSRSPPESRRQPDRITAQHRRAGTPCVKTLWLRRKKGGRDLLRTHPGTHFVPEETAEKMDEHVDGVRPAKNSQAKQARVEDEADGFEGDMKVPRSVLDECKSSFKAADEKREKASTQFFDDTGIMALLCRHDRVLWLVNMRTPGRSSTMRLLSWRRYSSTFRPISGWGSWRYLHRILFAVSVFHAFAHRWACQLIYHPLKCRGFGFTNGEGCERFWHSISKLIPYLRVAGYHHRLHTIDSQVEHADKASLRRLGAWLVRRTVHCEDKLQEVTKELAACGVAETVLREEWEKQVKAQTKPAERRSKTRGSAAVEEVILLRKRVDALFQKMTVLHDALADTQSTAHVLLYAQTHADAARNAWQKEQQRLRKLEQQLGVTDKTALEKLRHSDYYAARMNAKVLKDRVRQRLRERKFELDLIERSFRRTRSENQKNEHAAAAIKRREPTINNNVRDYNKLCVEISTLIQGKRAPAGAVAPTPIPVKGIFQLDVDDAIWQDLGLDDDTTPCPLAGGRESVKHAIELSHGAVRYQFELKRKELLQLCVVWRKSLDALPPASDLPAWGPTKEEIEDCEIEGVTASYEDGEDEDNERSSESDDETSSEDEDEDEEDEDLLYVIEAVERADIHRRRDTEEAEWATNDEDIFM